MLGRTLAALGLMAALFTSSAHAAVIQDLGGLASATSGIALGPDGNFWVSEELNDSVVRMTPAGAVLDRYPVGDGPTTVTTGPDKRVWVSVTGASRLVWFDATASSPSAHTVMGLPCAPVGLVAGGTRMYFSLPACGRLGTVAADGTDLHTTPGFGSVYDLELAGGKVFAPDTGDDVIRRVALDTALTIETAVAAPAGSGPDGVAADGAGNVWVTLFNTGRVGRFPASQDAGNVTELVPSGGPLTEPFGIVAGNDGRVYVAGKASGNLARINADGSFRFYPTSSQPWQLVNGPDGDLYFTDRASARVQRFISTAPRATIATATAVKVNTASVTATVDPRGNETQVVFDYGPTAGYGSTSAPVTVPAGSGGVPVTAALSGLTQWTTYHVRARATNEEGSVVGDDTTFTTPEDIPILTCGVPALRLTATAAKRCTYAPVPLPKLAARASFSWAFVGKRTLLRKLDITGLAGGETATVTCAGRNCPFKSKTYSNLVKGKKALGSRFGRKHLFSKGAKIEVRVTKPRTIGRSALVTVRGRKQAPKLVRSCLRPGATKTSPC